MIGVRDTLKLSATKLKTRKFRLIVTVVISSILFTFLLTASFIVRGVIKSEENFSKTGFGSRYIIQASPTNAYLFDNFTQPSPEVIQKAQTAEKTLQAQKAAEAKKLGIDYDPKADIPFVQEVDTPAGKVKNLNYQVPQVISILADEQKNQPGGLTDFEKTAKKYNAVQTYTSEILSNPANPNQYLQIIKNGQENFSQSATQNNNNQFVGPGQVNGVDGLTSQWQLMSQGLLDPFLLKDQNLSMGQDGSIPIIAPYSAAEQILGYKPLPATASSKEKLQRLTDVRKKAGGLAFTVCYRNSTSASDVQAAISQQQEILRNKNNKDYQKPDLIKDTPTVACGPIRITRDVRTADQKSTDAKQEQFRRDFGEAAPDSKLLKLRLVGINADAPTATSASVADIFKSILSSNLGYGWFSPVEVAGKDASINQIFALSGPASEFTNKSYYADMSNAANLKAIIAGENCQPNFPSNTSPASVIDPFAKCKKQGKYFGVAAWGSSSGAIDEFKKTFTKVFFIAGLVVAILATIIMLGTIGRVIADSRRETAVFRAIGAKRLDITQIYLTYAFMLGLLILGVSIFIALLMSSFVNHRYSPEVTVNALLAYNVTDLTQKFGLRYIYLKDTLQVAALIIGGALLASILPLLTNVRRNPIRDMRDER